MDPRERRRRAAISFLSNISLDGSANEPPLVSGEPRETVAEVHSVVNPHQVVELPEPVADDTDPVHPISTTNIPDEEPHTESKKQAMVIKMDSNSRELLNLTDRRLFLTTARGSPWLTCSVIPYRSRSEKEKDLRPDTEIGTTTIIANSSGGARVPLQPHSTFNIVDPLIPLINTTREELSYGHVFLAESINDYSANLIENSDFNSGSLSTVLRLSSYISSTITYTKPSELANERNKQFRLRFPHIAISFGEIRRLKQEMRKSVIDCGLDILIVAHSYVYFEKLVLTSYVVLANRRNCAAASVLLAAKLCDIGRGRLCHLVNVMERTLRITRKELHQYEFAVMIALKFALKSSTAEVLPHYQKLIYQL